VPLAEGYRAVSALVGVPSTGGAMKVPLLPYAKQLPIV
jgi:hypothetical protein